MIYSYLVRFLPPPSPRIPQSVVPFRLPAPSSVVVAAPPSDRWIASRGQAPSPAAQSDAGGPLSREMFCGGKRREKGRYK